MDGKYIRGNIEELSTISKTSGLKTDTCIAKNIFHFLNED